MRLRLLDVAASVEPATSSSCARGPVADPARRVADLGGEAADHQQARGVTELLELPQLPQHDRCPSVSCRLRRDRSPASRVASVRSPARGEQLAPDRCSAGFGRARCENLVRLTNQLRRRPLNRVGHRAWSRRCQCAGSDVRTCGRPGRNDDAERLRDQPEPPQAIRRDGYPDAVRASCTAQRRHIAAPAPAKRATGPRRGRRRRCRPVRPNAWPRRAGPAPARPRSRRWPSARSRIASIPSTGAAPAAAPRPPGRPPRHTTLAHQCIPYVKYT